MPVTETMERMALAVLKGDEAAALALADALQEGRREGEIALTPVHRLAASLDRIRVAVFTDPNLAAPDEGEIERLRLDLEDWLTGAGRIGLFHGVARIEVFEFPAALDAPDAPAA